MSVSQTKSDVGSTTRAFAIEAARLLADRRCEDVRLLDVTGLSQVCDLILIASGSSDRQMKSVASELGDEAEKQNHRVFRKNADTGTTWVVIDLVDLVVHLFEPELRMYYDIESLWAEGPAIEWRREDQMVSHRFEGQIGIQITE